MNGNELKQYFITIERPYREGCVEVLEQEIATTAVKKAELFITALGVYEAEIDGVKAGDALLAPGETYYPKNLAYQEIDVTQLFRGNAQEHTLRVYLGQGWYCGRFTFEAKTQIYGSAPAVSWILRTTDENGTERIFTSRDEGVCAVQSHYAYAGLYDGEIYYAEGSCVPEGTITIGAPLDKKPAAGAIGERNVPVLPDIVQPIPYEGQIPEDLTKLILPVTMQEEMPARAIIPQGERTIVDFGQNFAGIITIDPAKMSGDHIVIRHGELLNPDGSLYTGNLRKAKATLEYHKGEESAVYRPRFTYMGFRYAEISGCAYEEGLIRAFVIHSRMERTGDFTTGNEKVNRVYLNQLWSQRSNYVEVPTDCPQRDERMGYTGDGQAFAQTGAYNYDTRLFWKKFLQDIRYSQSDNTEGYVAPVIPAEGPAGIGFINMLGWGNCDTIVPEMLYRQFGTDEFLRDQYESMKTFTDCEIRHMGGALKPRDLWTGANLGDWLSPGKDIRYMAMHNGPVSNAFVVNDLRIMTETARRFADTQSERRYAEQLARSRAAYIRTYIKRDGTMREDYQGAYIMALQMVVDRKDPLWTSLYEKLKGRIRRDGMQTGFYSTAYLLPMLAENGDANLSFDLLLNERYPGWIYEVDHGATTIWERWDGIRENGTVNESDQNGSNMVSFNHYAFGSVGWFMYRDILGIQPLEPGFAKVMIAPHMDARLGFAKGSYRSVHGEISVEWKAEGDHLFVVKITTPVETEIKLQDGTSRSVSAGSYEYEVRD